MSVKLFDSELKIMNVLWQEGDCTAKHISDVLKEETGWNMNTTYTLIKRCIRRRHRAYRAKLHVPRPDSKGGSAGDRNQRTHRQNL